MADNAEIWFHNEEPFKMCYTEQWTVFWGRGTPDLALFTPKALFRFRKFASLPAGQLSRSLQPT